MICSGNPQMYRDMDPTQYDIPGTFGPYLTVPVHMYQDERYVGCGIPYGDGDSDTTISLFADYSNLYLHLANEYHFYFAYQLVEVTNGELA